MNTNKIVRNIVNEAFKKADMNGDSRYAVAEATLEVWLEEALQHLDEEKGKWFINRAKEYDY